MTTETKPRQPDDLDEFMKGGVDYDPPEGHQPPEEQPSTVKPSEDQAQALSRLGTDFHD